MQKLFNHFALILPTKTCSKTLISVKSTTTLKLEHLKEQAQKLATRMSFCWAVYTKHQMLLEIPGSMKILEAL